jgi:hypothetical protein
VWGLKSQFEQNSDWVLLDRTQGGVSVALLQNAGRANQAGRSWGTDRRLYIGWDTFAHLLIQLRCESTAGAVARRRHSHNDECVHASWSVSENVLRSPVWCGLCFLLENREIAKRLDVSGR